MAVCLWLGSLLVLNLVARNACQLTTIHGNAPTPVSTISTILATSISTSASTTTSASSTPTSTNISMSDTPSMLSTGAIVLISIVAIMAFIAILLLGARSTGFGQTQLGNSPLRALNHAIYGDRHQRTIVIRPGMQTSRILTINRNGGITETIVDPTNSGPSRVINHQSHAPENAERVIRVPAGVTTSASTNTGGITSNGRQTVIELDSKKNSDPHGHDNVHNHDHNYGHNHEDNDPDAPHDPSEYPPPRPHIFSRMFGNFFGRPLYPEMPPTHVPTPPPAPSRMSIPLSSSHIPPPRPYSYGVHPWAYPYNMFPTQGGYPYPYNEAMDADPELEVQDDLQEDGISSDLDSMRYSMRRPPPPAPPHSTGPIPPYPMPMHMYRHPPPPGPVPFGAFRPPYL